MKDVLDRFRSGIERATGKLARIGEAESSAPIAPGKWSRKQILGHLIDSASNNHQRFVRAQLEPRLEFPGYAQELWVSTQNYQEESWGYLVACWAGHNRHLLHVIAQIPAEKLAHTCVIGESDPVTLEFLVKDYMRHLEHHLDQIIG
ncbi:MAG: DinB family protein [Acidobacteria bacterium]|nr:DinB family protein [Acidobacteriota bacterium]